MKNFTQKKGFSLVEVLIAASIITIVGIAFAAVWSQYFKMTRVSDDASKAALLTGEAGEVLILFRDITWSGRIAPLTLGTRYYLSWNGSTYATSTIATNFQDNYALSFTMSSVRRDGSSDIVTSGGSIDASTLKATVIVSPLTSTSTIISSSELLIHNVYSN